MFLQKQPKIFWPILTIQISFQMIWLILGNIEQLFISSSGRTFHKVEVPSIRTYVIEFPFYKNQIVFISRNFFDFRYIDIAYPTLAGKTIQHLLLKLFLLTKMQAFCIQNSLQPFCNGAF